MDLPDSLSIRHELKPGDLGRLVALHGMAYETFPGFGLKFEAFVARTIADYGLESNFNGRLWLLEEDDELLGSCAVVLHNGRRGQIRWVVLHDRLRGLGLGHGLMEAALNWCRIQGLDEVFLETTDGLEASSGLYRKLGFRQRSSERLPMWDGPRPLITMAMVLNAG